MAWRVGEWSFTFCLPGWWWWVLNLINCKWLVFSAKESALPPRSILCVFSSLIPSLLSSCCIFWLVISQLLFPITLYCWLNSLRLSSFPRKFKYHLVEVISSPEERGSRGGAVTHTIYAHYVSLKLSEMKKGQNINVHTRTAVCQYWGVFTLFNLLEEHTNEMIWDLPWGGGKVDESHLMCLWMDLGVLDSNPAHHCIRTI